MSDEFFSNKNFTAFMVWNNSVYIKGDETNYTKNHLKLFKEIYDKDIYYVKDRLKQIMQENNVLGYYQSNMVIKEDRSVRIKTVNKYNVGDNLVQMYITTTLPDFKLVLNGAAYNCTVQ